MYGWMAFGNLFWDVVAIGVIYFLGWLISRWREHFMATEFVSS